MVICTESGDNDRNPSQGFFVQIFLGRADLFLRDFSLVILELEDDVFGVEIMLDCVKEILVQRYGSGMTKLMLGVGAPEELIPVAEGNSED